MRVFRLIAALLAAMSAPALAGGTTTIGNAATGGSIDPFGRQSAGTATYGQVFWAPVTGKLTSFSFWLNGSVGQVRGVVGTWNDPAFNYMEGRGSPTTLWDSGAMSVPASGQITFNPNIDVIDFATYVAYLTVYDVPGDQSTTSMQLGDNSDFHLRYYVFNEGSSDPRGNPAWSYDQSLGNARFEATVGVPEPAQWAMLIGGFGVIGAVARRRRSGVALTA